MQTHFFFLLFSYAFHSNVSDIWPNATFFFQLTVCQIMYGVLYAISPELFPAKDRGTGNGLTATATRVFGILVRLSRPCPAHADELKAIFEGSHHRFIRKSSDGCPRVCFRGTNICCWRSGTSLAL